MWVCRILFYVVVRSVSYSDLLFAVGSLGRSVKHSSTRLPVPLVRLLLHLAFLPPHPNQPTLSHFNLN